MLVIVTHLPARPELARSRFGHTYTRNPREVEIGRSQAKLNAYSSVGAVGFPATDLHKLRIWYDGMGSIEGCPRHEPHANFGIAK